MEHIKDLLPKAAAELTEQLTSGVSGSTRMLEGCDAFLTFDDPALERMKLAAESFLHEMQIGDPPRWVSFLGSSGAGKTMLAKWIKEIFKRDLDWKINWPATEQTKTATQPFGRIIRHRGGYQTWAGITRNLREQEYRIFDDLCALTFLVVDDIGAEHGSDFINSKLYELCSRRERKWTVFTGNLSLEDIEQRIDARIASRMIRNGSVVIDVDVPDFNLRPVSEPRSAFQEVKKIMQGES